jgi:poly(3-hydroxybutyrate) depolymerase
MAVRKCLWVRLIVAVGLSACGGRIGLFNNVPDGGAPDGAAPPSFQPLDVNAVWRGAGCGQALPPEQITTVPGSPKGYTQFKVMGTGANLTSAPIAAKAGPRTFWVRVPADYDRNKPYRVVFLGQGCGGYQMANTATFALYKESAGGTEQAIYVAMDIPEDGANADCYDNRSGRESQEWEAFELFMTFVDQRYCVDLNKIYVAGNNTGGWLANQWGCYFAGWPTPPRKFAPRYHIRAQAALSGNEPAEQPTCGGPVAALWLHDQNDVANPLADTLPALARVGRTNGCETTYDRAVIQEPWHADVPAIGDVCKRFADCPRDYPVVFCTTSGIRIYQEERTVSAMTLFFDEIEAGRR